ncbi:MAG: OmpA family protein [Desulfobacula sp.]|jgi:flagellar motor protein MotB|nr:OmpA family protein [Desulfobacula sp.]
MVKGYSDNRTGLERFLIWLAMLISLCFFIGLAEAGQADRKKNIHLELQAIIIQNYQDQITFIGSEIIKIQQDAEWLSLKVKKMEDFTQFVPQRLYDSIVFKKSKIQSLEKLKQRYETLVKSTDLNPGGKQTKDHRNSGFETNLRKKILGLGLEDWLELIPDDTPLCLENRLPMLFSSGSAAIAKGYKPFIKKLATLIKGYDVRIVINGYADTDPIRTKQYPSNFELGAARASSVAHALIQYGIKPSVFKIGSTGEYRFDSHKASEWKNLQRHVNISIFFISKV